MQRPADSGAKLRRGVALSGAVSLTLGLACAAAAQSATGDARSRVPWLDVPGGWTLGLQGTVVAVTPGDLPAGASLLLLVEPPVRSGESLDQAWEHALRDLGPWKPVGKPLEQQLNGWSFRHGLGVTTLNGVTYTSHTAVALRGNRLVRMWVLANTDATYNRYKTEIVNAIASIQDITNDPADAPATPSSNVMSAPAAGTASALMPGFGQGLSGAWIGMERGLRATAGIAPGGGIAPSSVIEDFQEVDVLFPDGTYRRRLPVRGLGSDLAWERRQQPILWGTWSRSGDVVTIRRGDYTTTYTVDGDALVSDRGRKWVKLAIPVSARIDGTFARDDYRDPDAPRLILREDGTYEDRGGFLRMVGDAWNLVTPDGNAMVSRWSEAEARRALGPGSGTYTFDAFTLTLVDRDGRIWKINAWIPPGESPPRPRRLVINGRTLVRE